MDQQWPVPPPFIGGEELRGLLDADRPVRLVDVRWSLDGAHGRHGYTEGHVPGAVYADLDTDLAGEPSAAGGRHPLPTPTAFAGALGRLGVGLQDLIVAYDQGSGAIAARLVWMCRAIGQPASVLAGGLAGWDGSLEAGSVRVPAVERPAVAWPVSLLADADLVDRLRQDPDAVVIDARAVERYRGGAEPVDARPGHVPGAVNLPVADNLADDGGLADEEQLRARYARAGALDAAEVVAYCGSGVTACHDLLVLEQLGRRGRLFPGSWSAWSADLDRPVATGSDAVPDATGADEPGRADP